MENLVLVINIILAVLLIVVILIEKSEGGALGLGVSQDSFVSSRSAGSTTGFIAGGATPPNPNTNKTEEFAEVVTIQTVSSSW